jgi:predicted Zn finger-like uncharacterized protein
MLIVCPTCSTSYNIDSVSLGRDGRTVRCGRCKNLWFAAPPSPVAGFVADVIAEAEAREAPAASPPATTTVDVDDFGPEASHAAAEAPAVEEPESATQEAIPAGEAPSLVPPMGETAQIAEPNPDAGSFAARRVRMHAKRKEKRKSSKWTAAILVLLGFNVALIGARNEVVRYVPQTASLFAAIGLPVNLRHLTFEDVKITKEENDGVPVLTVEGTIASQSNNPVEVPRIRFAVRNATNQEIYAWTTRPNRSILGPGEKLPFRSRLASPPAEASDVMVRFVNASDAAAGK